MRALSESTEQLLKQARRARVDRDAGLVAELLQRIPAEEGIALVPRLLQHLHPVPHGVTPFKDWLKGRGKAKPDCEAGVPVAAQRIAEVLDRMVPKELPQLASQLVRSSSSDYGPFPDYMRFSKVPAMEHEPFAMTAIASMHASGYVREDAVVALSESGDPRAVPYLILRLNDWVPQVRDAAKAAISSCLTSDAGDAFVRCLPLVVRLQSQRRDSHEVVLQAISGLIGQGDSQDALLKMLDAKGGVMSQAAFLFLTRSPQRPPGKVVLEHLSKSPNIGFRAWVAKYVPEQCERTEALEHLDRLVQDRSWKVRREAMRGLLSLDPTAAEPFLQEGLVHSSAAMRQFCRFFLKKAGVSDFEQIYRDRIGDDQVTTRCAAIEGLGETGTQDDVPRVLGCLRQDDRCIVRSSLRAICNLDRDQGQLEVHRHLGDLRPGVARAACRLLPRVLSEDDIREIRRVVHEVDAPHVRNALRNIVRRTPHWTQLELLLSFAACNETRHQAWSRVELTRWEYRHHHLADAPRDPTAAEVKDLSTRLAKLPKGNLDGVARRIGDVLGANA